MKLKEAMASLRNAVRYWELGTYTKRDEDKATLPIGTASLRCAIETGQTLLAALETREEGPRVIGHRCIRCSEILVEIEEMCSECRREVLSKAKPADRPVRCAKCGGWLDSHAILCPLCSGVDKPAARPPEKGDWVTESFMTHPHKVVSVSGGKIQRVLWTQTQQVDEWVSDREPIIVRRAADRLRVGDKVSFGSKEGWLFAVVEGEVTPYGVNFSANEDPTESPSKLTNRGWFRAKDLTLVQPVFDRPAEKGDC